MSEDNEDDTALVAGRFKGRFKGRCRKCGKFGHKAAQCRSGTTNNMEITSLTVIVFCADDMDTRNWNVGIIRTTHKTTTIVETTMKTQITHQNEKSWKMCH